MRPRPDLAATPPTCRSPSSTTIAVDNDAPFYNVYGGTQDNFTLGGPSRTNNAHGITQQRLVRHRLGDGFDPVIDPTNPNIIYAESQYGGLVRFDRRTGETIDIKPQAGARASRPCAGTGTRRSSSARTRHTRLYFGAKILFRSDDRGDTWKAVSPDLTRNSTATSSRSWAGSGASDAVAKNDSTSFYGNIVALAESPMGRA